MIIAMPTNDRINLAQKSGRAKEFVFWNIDDNEVFFVENPHTHEHDDEHNHNHNHSHKDMIKLFKDNKAEALIVDVVGKHFKRDLFDENFTVYRTDLKSLKEIAQNFKENKNNFKLITE